MKTELSIIQTQIWILIYTMTTNNIMQTACIVGVTLGMIDLALQFKKKE
jgi:hypothetical protein